MKHIDRSDLVVIAQVLKWEIQRIVDDGESGNTSWIYESSRALSSVLREMDCGSMNPFDKAHWEVITNQE